MVSLGVTINGKNTVIVNHSDIVGKLLSLMMLNRDSAVDVCHVKTKNLKQHTEKVDIVIVAADILKLIKSNMIKDGAVVIDVGINRMKGKICGDVDFENVRKKTF